MEKFPWIGVQQMSLLYLIDIHWLSVDFDLSTAGHAEGVFLSHAHITLWRHICAAALVVIRVC